MPPRPTRDLGECEPCAWDGSSRRATRKAGDIPVCYTHYKRWVRSRGDPGGPHFERRRDRVHDRDSRRRIARAWNRQPKQAIAAAFGVTRRQLYNVRIRIAEDMAREIALGRSTETVARSWGVGVGLVRDWQAVLGRRVVDMLEEGQSFDDVATALDIPERYLRRITGR